MTKADKIKSNLQTTGKWFVGQARIPTDQPLLLMLITDGGMLNQQEASKSLRLDCGIPNRALPRDTKRMPNAYPFLIYISSEETEMCDEYGNCTSIPILADCPEAWISNVVVCAVWKSPQLVTQTDSLMAELRDRVTETDSFWKNKDFNYDMILPNTELNANGWYVLKLTSSKSLLPTTLDMEKVLVDHGYSVLAPDSRFPLSMFVGNDIFTTHKYRKIFFSPGGKSGVTANQLAQEVFFEPGYQVSLHTSTELQRQSSLLNNMHSGQKATDDLADSIKNLMKALSNIIGSTSYILYGLLGLGALVVGYKAYKHLGDQNKGDRK